MLAIGSDHAVFDFKEEVKRCLDDKEIAYKDLVAIQKAEWTIRRLLKR